MDPLSATWDVSCPDSAMHTQEVQGLQDSVPSCQAGRVRYAQEASLCKPGAEPPVRTQEAQGLQGSFPSFSMLEPVVHEDGLLMHR